MKNPLDAHSGIAPEMICGVCCAKGCLISYAPVVTALYGVGNPTINLLRFMEDFGVRAQGWSCLTCDAIGLLQPNSQDPKSLDMFCVENEPREATK